MPDEHGAEILVAGAHALARSSDREAALRGLLASAAEPLGFESAAIFVVSADGGLDLAASIGVGEAAAANLAAAVRNPMHPIARTLTDPVPTFDVPPTAPGGPALRSHLPLVIERRGNDIVVGVLAVAHDRSMTSAGRLLEAIADLSAVAVGSGNGS